MAADIVNLRQARKRRARAERDEAAERNRFEHGRTRAERDLAARVNRKATAEHDAKRLERGGVATDAVDSIPAATSTDDPDLSRR